jgi:hypothetical protein
LRSKSWTKRSESNTRRARPAGPPPLTPAAGQDGIVEIERTVSRSGTIALGGQVILAAEILGGRRIGVRTPIRP